MAKSSKLYKDSPKITKDDEGRPGVQKPDPADSENAGLEGNPLPGSEGKMPVNEEHMAEHKAMHKRHEEETKSMHERHESDLKEMHKRHEKTKGKEAEPEKQVEGTK